MVNWKGGPVGESSQQPSSGVPIRMLESPPLSGSPRSEDSDTDLRDQDQSASRKRKTLPRWTKQIRVFPGMGVEGPLDDGYSWRKYGQKDILGAKYPRGYYRCTHRNVQGCLATKQVQRSDEDPTVFEITYRGTHTCSMASNVVAASGSGPQEINQESNLNTGSQQNVVPISLEQQSNELLMNLRAGLRVQTENLDASADPNQSFAPSLHFLSANSVVKTEDQVAVNPLSCNADFSKIPPLFFIHMPMLHIVDLSYTSVRELPSSFFNLEQLRELYLKGCECFMRLPPGIGKLRKLEKLDLEETHVIHLPKEFQELTNMQSLTLYFYEYRGKKHKPYSCSTIIPPGVISKFQGLKHLCIGVNPDDERWHDNVQVIFPEILGLKCLQTLSLYVPQLELLKLIPARILDIDFRFIVGSHLQRIISSIPLTVDVKFKQSDRCLKFVKGVDVPSEIKMLLGHSKALFLDRHMTIKNLFEFEMKNLERLRVCILSECKGMQTIVDGRKSNGHANDDVLSHLLFLSVSQMKNLRSIWEGPTPPRSSFGMLQSLSLQSCPKLISLFSLDFLGNLSLLKELLVKDCPKLSALISHESSNLKVDIFLPKLRKLSLVHLPSLDSISNGLCIGPNLKEIGIYDCPKLRSLSLKELSSPKLVVIKGETSWWKALKWSQVEWGISGRPPSRFDSIFSPINEDADLMTQLGLYKNGDDIVDDTGNLSSHTFHVPFEFDSFFSTFNEDGDLMTQLGMYKDEDDIFSDTGYRSLLNFYS